MVRFTGGLLLFAAFAATAASDPPLQRADAQQPLPPEVLKTQPAPRKLHGRFLHITDIHPDPFYKVHSDPEQACHFGRGISGHYGAEVTDCDSPLSLVNATFKWIEENLKDYVDFVIWTGDSARHDNDDRLPRTDKQVIKLNRLIVDKFVETFGKSDNIDDPDPTNDFVVPIVPTFGNNDILPHNIFLPGPNKWTREYETIWNKFVPEAQRHSFARGGWFFAEVIPNRLAVFSLNTLYFFDSNSAVDGCDLHSEPGYEHFEWLRIQLQFLRQRGMKAILTGHVPPARTANKQSWDESCYQKYTLWLRQYRDVIVTSIFGHMNLDHFMFQDAQELKYEFKIDGVDDELTRTRGWEPQSNNETFSIAAKAQYLNDLRSGWSDLPKPPSDSSYLDLESTDYETEKKKKKKPNELEKFLKAIGGPWGERFSLSLVSPSVVPNFFPTLRIVEYNISGLEDHSPATRAIGTPAPTTVDANAIGPNIAENECASFQDEPCTIHELKKKKKKKKGKKGKKRKKLPKFPVPKPPSRSSPPGPGYSPQALSLLSWKQYYANLTAINDEIHSDTMKGHHKHFKYITEYTTNNDSNYQMQDLTLRSLLNVAEMIAREHLPKPKEQEGEEENGQETVLVDETDVKSLNKAKDKGKKNRHKVKKARNHLWRVFIKRAFVHTKPDEDIDEDFGGYEQE